MGGLSWRSKGGCWGWGGVWEGKGEGKGVCKDFLGAGGLLLVLDARTERKTTSCAAVYSSPQLCHSLL